jgi:hypothetical protein
VLCLLSTSLARVRAVSHSTDPQFAPTIYLTAASIRMQPNQLLRLGEYKLREGAQSEGRPIYECSDATRTQRPAPCVAPWHLRPACLTAKLTDGVCLPLL